MEQKENHTQKTKKNVVRYQLVRHKWPDEIQAEKERKIRNVIVACVCIACFFGGYLTKGFLAPVSSSEGNEKFSTIYDIMKNEWYFGKDQEDLEQTLLDQAINGMLIQEEDPHTMYMAPQEYENFTTSLQGNYVGIGIQYYASDSNHAMVERVMKGGGAEKGGMMEGDIITKVDGVRVEDKTLDEIAELIKGEEGTQVTISVLRENEEKELTITRGVVSDSVYGYMREDAAVLEISSFSETSGQETGKYLKDFQDKGVKDLIIDLRSNGGGYVTAATEIVSYFVGSDGLVYQEQHRDGTIKKQKTKAENDWPRYSFDQIVILINNETASASEVLTASLKEQLSNVTVVGVKSYGKGTIQVPVTFEDGSSLKYTIAEWLTPNGEHLNKKGITPDVEAILPQAVTTGIPDIAEDAVYQKDHVSIYAKPVQIYLDFLGYEVDRFDEYFSLQSSLALKQYQSEHGLQASGDIDQKTVQSLLSSCALKWHDEQTQLDTQMQAALEVLQK